MGCTEWLQLWSIVGTSDRWEFPPFYKVHQQFLLQFVHRYNGAGRPGESLISPMSRPCVITPAPHLVHSGLISGLRPANERRCYFVTTSLIGWAKSQNQPAFLPTLLPQSQVCGRSRAWVAELVLTTHHEESQWNLLVQWLVRMLSLHGIWLTIRLTSTWF